MLRDVGGDGSWIARTRQSIQIPGRVTPAGGRMADQLSSLRYAAAAPCRARRRETPDADAAGDKEDQQTPLIVYWGSTGVLLGMVATAPRAQVR